MTRDRTAPNLLLDASRVVLLVGTILRHAAAPLLGGLARGRLDRRLVGVRLRLVLEKMGMTYLKLGQFLATRFDLLPLEVCQELDRLFEGVPPMKFPTVRRLVERELGRPLAEAFESFDEETLGSASVAQVHRARARDGEVVAVKVQRERVADIFAADMRNLKRMAAVVDATGFVGSISLAEVVREFASFTGRELHFLEEARTAARLRAQHSSFAYVPRIRWDLTTDRLLVMEYIEGVSLARVNVLLEEGRPGALAEALPGVDMASVTRDLAYATFHQLFVSGFFHADPHPGNILVKRDGTVVFVDFGIFGELAPDQLDTLMRYIENLTLGNIDESYRLYTRLIIPSRRTDMAAFKRAAKTLLWDWHRANNDPATPAEERHLGRFSDQLLGLLYRHDIRLSLDTLLFWRTLIVLDATSLRPSKEFDLTAALRDFFAKYRPDPVRRFTDVETIRELGATVLQLSIELPQQSRRVLDDLTVGRIGIVAARQKSPGERRGTNRRLMLVPVPLVAVAAAVLATSLGRGVFLASAVAFLLVALAAVSRR